MKKLCALLMVVALSATVIATPDLEFSPGGTMPGGWMYTGIDSTSGTFTFNQGIDIDFIQGSQSDALFKEYLYLPDMSLAGYTPGIMGGLGSGVLSTNGIVEIRTASGDLLLSGTLGSGSYQAIFATSALYPEINTDIYIDFIDNSIGSAYLDSLSEGMYFDLNLTIQASTVFDTVIQRAGTASNGFSGSMTAIVPEPMTMALLGLGGLLLRRKK